ncbi:hypothetical protein BKA62DRAFT_715486 [Auriculariales sp. MPI-PUGE-AT-0066]|nr:hypothetical protein BKA62DRAFT_715486 [Auriculariales sp. MPI-PUGE-AT-0066]
MTSIAHRTDVRRRARPQAPTKFGVELWTAIAHVTRAEDLPSFARVSRQTNLPALRVLYGSLSFSATTPIGRMTQALATLASNGNIAAFVQSLKINWDTALTIDRGFCLKDDLEEQFCGAIRQGTKRKAAAAALGKFVVVEAVHSRIRLQSQRLIVLLRDALQNTVNLRALALPATYMCSDIDAILLRVFATGGIRPSLTSLSVCHIPPPNVLVALTSLKSFNVEGTCLAADCPASPRSQHTAEWPSPSDSSITFGGLKSLSCDVEAFSSLISSSGVSCTMPALEQLSLIWSLEVSPNADDETLADVADYHNLVHDMASLHCPNLQRLYIHIPDASCLSVVLPSISASRSWSSSTLDRVRSIIFVVTAPARTSSSFPPIPRRRSRRQSPVAGAGHSDWAIFSYLGRAKSLCPSLTAIYWPFASETLNDRLRVKGWPSFAAQADNWLHVLLTDAVYVQTQTGVKFRSGASVEFRLEPHTLTKSMKRGALNT